MTGQDVADKAKSLLLMGTIPYALGGDTLKGMDCQGLVEWTLRELGMAVDTRGTNDMWRNLVTVKGSIEDGVAKLGSIPLGALVFIVDQDGGEPARYQGDGEGNAWHVYIKISDEMLIHASASNLMVTTRLFADQTIPNGGPNAYGLISGVDYGVAETAAESASVSVGQSWTPRFSRLTFKTGCVGGGVRELQTGLNKLGNRLTVDGHFGPLTEETVVNFQRATELEPDGIVGPETWNALVRAVNA